MFGKYDFAVMQHSSSPPKNPPIIPPLTLEWDLDVAIPMPSATWKQSLYCT